MPRKRSRRRPRTRAGRANARQAAAEVGVVARRKAVMSQLGEMARDYPAIRAVVDRLADREITLPAR